MGSQALPSSHSGSWTRGCVPWPYPAMEPSHSTKQTYLLYSKTIASQREKPGG